MSQSKVVDHLFEREQMAKRDGSGPSLLAASEQGSVSPQRVHRRSMGVAMDADGRMGETDGRPQGRAPTIPPRGMVRARPCGRPSHFTRTFQNFALCHVNRLLLFLLLLRLFTPPAYADGGAPQLAYVAGTAQGIGIIDIAQRRVTGTMATGGNPRTVLLSLDGHALYVTQPTLGRVAVIMAKTGKTLCAASLPGQPSLLALSLDATVLYAAGEGDSGVRALDPRTCAVQRTFETAEPVYGLAVTASTAANATPSTPNQLWIAGSTALTVFDVNGHLLGSVPIASGPQNISIPGGFTAYVTTRQGSIVAVDLNTRKVIRTLISGGQFGPMDYNANTGEVYVPDREHNQLDVLTPITAGTTARAQEPLRIIHLSSSPQSVAITSDGQLGFVALSNGQVLMLDIPGRNIVTSIAVGGAPRFIITGLYPPVDSPAPTSPQVATPPPETPSLLLIGLIVLAGVLLLCMLWLFWRYNRKRYAEDNNFPTL